MTYRITYAIALASAAVIFLQISSCNTTGDNGFSESYSHTFQKDRQIVVDTMNNPSPEPTSDTLLTLSLDKGTALVFKYQYDQIAPKNIADGDFSETIYFQLPYNTESIRLDDKQLEKGHVYYTRSCFCPRIGVLSVSEGYLEAEKITQNIWSVSASLKINTEYESRKVIFDRTFVGG